MTNKNQLPPVNKNQMPAMNSDVAGSHVPASISPTPGVQTPGLDMNPAGLAGNPHVEDPKAVETDLDRDLLKDFADKAGIPVNPMDESKKASAVEEEDESPSKPVLKGQELKHNELKLPKAPKEGFEVIATEAGFYNQERKVENDVFSIAKFEEVGSWMRFTDPDLDKKRREYFELKNDLKRKARK